MTRSSHSSSPSGTLRQIAPLLGLGIELALLVLLGVGGGHWVDGRYDTSPWGILVGGVVGIAVGFYHFLRAVWPRNRDPQEKDRPKDVA